MFTDYLTDPLIHHIGTEEPTAYFVPELPSGEKRERSPRLFSLNGSWAFRYSPAGNEETLRELLETEDFSGWSSIPVPSNWQLHGYDHAQYIPLSLSVRPAPCAPGKSGGTVCPHLFLPPSGRHETLFFDV